jgi:8-oxo-dGTP pyrophosphatase MutT (NUDIX family)
VSDVAAHLAADLRAVLDGWSAPTQAQESLRAAFIAHLEAHPDAVLKAGPPAHFTASCFVLDGTGEQVLLTHHKRANAWFQFGGHLEPGDGGVHAAATREAREESGIAALLPLPRPVALDRHALVGDFVHCREHLDVRFAALAPEGAAHTTSEESHDVRWWPVAELPAFAEPALVAHVRLAQQALSLA